MIMGKSVRKSDVFMGKSEENHGKAIQKTMIMGDSREIHWMMIVGNRIVFSDGEFHEDFINKHGDIMI